MKLYRIINKGDESGSGLNLSKCESKVVNKRIYLCPFMRIGKIKTNDKRLVYFNLPKLLLFLLNHIFASDNLI